MPSVELFYASRDPGRADAYARRFSGQAFGSYADGLAEPSVDVALIATPTVTHRDLAVRSLEAGKHVIVEKPAFMRSSDCDDVRELAAAVDRRVFVAENYVYKPLAQHLRRLVTAGDLGEVRFITLNATKRQRPEGWRSDPAVSGGGALFEGGVHWISFASNIGLEVRSVTGYCVGRDRKSTRLNSSH